MTRRLLALMMAVVVGGAPEALEACQVICATVTPGGGTTPASGIAHHHSHHREAAPTGRPALQAVSYACGPGDALLPSAARQSARATGQPSIAATVQAFPIVRQSTRPHSPSLHRKPPGLVFLAGALRV